MSTKTAAEPEAKTVTGEFWSAKQRQSNSLHEISYRACFKAELVAYFVKQFSHPGDYVYDPFGGRGTTAVEAALLGRIPVSNDINPLSQILTLPRLTPPTLEAVEAGLERIFASCPSRGQAANHEVRNDLPMFYADETYREIIFLKKHLSLKKSTAAEGVVDRWIRMVATNRLTGHSAGFLSGYTLPPNQAASKASQIKINRRKNQTPSYKNVKAVLLKKSRSLLSELGPKERKALAEVSPKKIIVTQCSRNTTLIPSNLATLVVCSPPFLDTVSYLQDNWLRCWFNEIDTKKLKEKITVLRTLAKWEQFIFDTLLELKRVLKKGGKIAFEVGEVRKGELKLDEIVVQLAEQARLRHLKTYVNQQNFTKTSNLWGIKNNTSGTNSNRIVLLEK